MTYKLSQVFSPGGDFSFIHGHNPTHLSSLLHAVVFNSSCCNKRRSIIPISHFIRYTLPVQDWFLLPSVDEVLEASTRFWKHSSETLRVDVTSSQTYCRAVDCSHDMWRLWRRLEDSELVTDVPRNHHALPTERSWMLWQIFCCSSSASGCDVSETLFCIPLL